MRAAPPHSTPPGDGLRAARVTGDRCPTAIKLHPAADGLIARVRLPGGRLTPEQALLLAGWAAPTADGAPADRIELTGRGNLQLRGLTAEQSGPLAAALHSAGLLPSEPHDQARTIVASPLAGRLPGAAPVDDLIRAIDAAICADPDLTALSGRFLIAVDDGTGAVSTSRADLALRRESAVSFSAALDERVTLLVAGTSVGTVALRDAPAAVVVAARSFLAEAAGAAWQIRELPDPAKAAIAAVLWRIGGVAPHGPGGPPTRQRPASTELSLGPGRQADGRGYVRALAPLGRLTARQLETVAGLAAIAGSELRISGDRSITIPDLPLRHETPTADGLGGAGLLVSAGHPGVGLTACAGLGCASSRGDVRAAAALRLATRGEGGRLEHLVGCDRRCGAPATGEATTHVLGEGESAEAFAERITPQPRPRAHRRPRPGARRFPPRSSGND